VLWFGNHLITGVVSYNSQNVSCLSAYDPPKSFKVEVPNRRAIFLLPYLSLKVFFLGKHHHYRTEVSFIKKAHSFWQAFDTQQVQRVVLTLVYIDCEKVIGSVSLWNNDRRYNTTIAAVWY
jgi:mannitol-1-phosphate/altronate dehydrogenase